jgi:hypothetical protein
MCSMSPKDIEKILNRDMQMLKGFINFKNRARARERVRLRAS